MVFKSTDAQQAELEKLLADQQDVASPNYHRWLSSDEFADRFGLSQNDINKIVTWLQAQGFTVNTVARNRQSVTFSGSAQRIEKTFGTAIHEYNINGATYYGNAGDPVVPPSLADVVSGFRSLNNFRLTPRVRARTVAAGTAPQFTSETSGNHYISPADFATIYDLAGPYANGLNGTGQTIAVMGQTRIVLNDIEAFRAASGLPSNDPEMVLVPSSVDPGISVDDLAEADLDLEWAGAIAPMAHIIYVYSPDVMESFQYAISQNLAPIVSISYGACENNNSPQETRFLANLGQQANAQGITILAPAGDSGAADCDFGPNVRTARQGLSVDMPASLPYVTGVGGSEFRENSDSWSNTNSANNGSALSYLPEVVWNDTAASSRLAAGGGGRSANFSKPTWQSGRGVPNDNVRDVPDVSFSASPDHDGYLICSNGSCANGFRSTNGTVFVVGGTSVSTPSFAGIVALVNQKVGSAQGNINPILYGLAATAPQAFHDITVGGNQVPCRIGTVDCSTGSIGYSAGPGYDQASGIGSVDVANLVVAWPVPNTGNPPGGPTTPPPPISGVVPQPISAVEQGIVRSGYAVITPDANSSAPIPTVTFGIVKGGVVQSQAAVSPIPTITEGSLFVDVIPGIGRNVGLAFVNLSSLGNTVTLTLKDKNGGAAGATTLSIASQQQLARLVTELFSSTTIGATFIGSLQVQSSLPLNILGLSFSGVQFSTLPVAVNATASATRSIVLPQFAMGGGWATQIALFNNGSATISGRVDVFDTSGQPMNLALNGVSQSTFSYSISPGGVFVLAPRDSNGQSPF